MASKKNLLWTPWKGRSQTSTLYLSATLTKFLPYRFSSITLKPNTPVIIVSLPPPITVIYVAALHNVPEVAKNSHIRSTHSKFRG